MIKKPLFALFVAALAVPAYAENHEEHPPGMTAEDLVTMPRLGGPTVTPDGRYAVYPVTETDPQTLTRTTHLWMFDTNAPEKAHIRLESLGEAHDPSFAADGWLYYVAEAAGDGPDAGSMQIFKAALEGDGNVTGPIQVSDFKAGFAGYKLSPDGKRVLVWGDARRECTGLDCDGVEPATEPQGSGRLYDAEDGFIRHWDTWEEPGIYGRAFAYAIPADLDAKLSDPIAIDGPAGDDALLVDTPVKPFGGGEELAWSAGSDAVFFAARVVDKSEPTSTNLDIYRSALDGAAPDNLTGGNLATDTQPTPSPDGKWLAYLAMERPGYESDRLVIQLRDLSSGETRALTDGFDRSFSSLTWTPDSRHILATAADVLDYPAFRVDIRSGGVARLDLIEGNEARIGSLTPLPNNRLLFTRAAIEHPNELFLSRRYRTATQVTDVATSRLAAMNPVVTERFSFAGAEGDTVWGWITKPANHHGDLPAILYVHGGPQGTFNDSWSSRWNARTVASQGYAVVAIDFHGSAGYGQDFMDSINRDWGGKPLVDLQLGLAAALERDNQIDGTRTCAMGASYGGYMMNWIAGKWPDRFNCLVQHDGLFDMRSFYYVTEELWFPRWDFGGSYAEVPEEYERWNPVNHVGNWKTPMLVIAGERDFRVPYTQGIASFTALQEQDVPAQLLVFPDENHWVLGVRNSLQWHETVFAWLDRWLKE